MNEIIELLEQGRVVVAKAGEKADPEDLGIAALEYCEGAGFTIDEVRRVEMVIYSAIREIMDRYEKNTDFSIMGELKEYYEEKRKDRMKKEGVIGMRPTKATGLGVRLEAERNARGMEIIAPTMVPRNAMQMVSSSK